MNDESPTGPLECLVGRLRDEADLCRNETADDIAVLLDEAADEIQRMQADSDIGSRWRQDSSLETWFPFTALELERLRVEAARYRWLRDVPATTVDEGEFRDWLVSRPWGKDEFDAELDAAIKRHQPPNAISTER